MTKAQGRADTTEERDLFRSLIRGAAAHADNQSSILADQHHECAYAQIPGFLEEIQSFLASNKVDPADCIVLELNNSLRAALGVLALLDAGRSFMAMPAPGRRARAGASSVEHPKFCRWVVSTSAHEPKHALNDTPLSELFELRPNPGFDESANRPSERGPRLFFRTSGSLGASKIVKYRYGNFYRNALCVLEIRRFGPSHRIALPTPIFHTYGLGSGFLPGLAAGAAIDFQERSNVLRYFEREADFAPNVAYVTPSFCEMLVRGRRSRRLYELMITSGDRISESTFRRSEELHGTMVSQYGTAELGVVATSEPDMPFDLRCRTVGRPLKNAEIRVVEIAGSATGNDCGELQFRCRRGYGFEGYVDLNGRRVASPGSFDGDWYRTGDLATINPDGSLAVLGRCDLSVNRGGVLLPLADIECRMRELEGVEDVAVAVSGSDSLRGSSLIAFCVVSRDCETTGTQLRARFAGTVPSFAVPESVRVVSTLPKLANGKIDRMALAELAKALITTVDG